MSYPSPRPKPLSLCTASPDPQRPCCQREHEEMVAEKGVPHKAYPMSWGQGLPTQLQCFYQVLRKVQKLEMWEVTEVFHLLDLVSCQRQEAVGGKEGVQRQSCIMEPREEGRRTPGARGPWLSSLMMSGDLWPLGWGKQSRACWVLGGQDIRLGEVWTSSLGHGWVSPSPRSLPLPQA